MKAQRRLGLSLTWPRLTTVFLVDIVIMVVASHCPESWQGTYRIAFWVGVGLAVLVTLLSLVTYHGITVASGLATWLWDWSADPGSALAAGCTPALDHQRRFGRDKVGVREYKGQLVSVIAVNGGEDETGSRHRHRAASPTLLVAAVASGCASSISTSTTSTSCRSRSGGAVPTPGPPSCRSSTTSAPRSGTWSATNPPPTFAGPGWCCG